MYLSGGTPLGRSLQEKVNDYWKELGKKYHFYWKTVKPKEGDNKRRVEAKMLPYKALLGINTEEEERVKYKRLYGYADGHIRDEKGSPIMTVIYCDEEKYKEEFRVNWQTAYSWKIRIT